MLPLLIGLALAAPSPAAPSVAPVAAPARARFPLLELGSPRRTYGLLAEPGRLPKGEPISLVLKDADLGEVVSFVGGLLAKNVVLDPSVRGSVTVSLRDVPAGQVLDLLLSGHGLAARLDGNVLVVGRARNLASW